MTTMVTQCYPLRTNIFRAMLIAEDKCRRDAGERCVGEVLFGLRG